MAEGLEVYELSASVSAASIAATEEQMNASIDTTLDLLFVSQIVMFFVGLAIGIGLGVRMSRRTPPQREESK